jgi:hypothetical protein
MRASCAAVVVVCAALVSVAESGTKTAGAYDYFRMKHVQVIDQSSFDKPILAADLAFADFRWRVDRELSVLLLGLSSFSNGPWDCCPHQE